MTGTSEGQKSSQCLYDATGDQRQRRHTLVQGRYGNRTTLADVYHGTDKFCLPTRIPVAHQQSTDQQHRTVSNDGRLTGLRAQLVASADCIYCRYGSLDACRPTNTTADVRDVCRRHDSQCADISTDSLQHSSSLTT